MPKSFLAKGARGELVRKVQVALIEAGVDPHGADGTFGQNTEAAVRQFQLKRGLEPSGRVDHGTWAALLPLVPPPSTYERSLQLTAAFEGHGFSLAQGNWDGAGITWGIIGFTLKHGELGKIILQVFDESPGLVRQSFGENTQKLLDMLHSPKARQMEFADRISVGAAKIEIEEPWRSAFKAFGEIPQVQAIQMQMADHDYGEPALETALELQLRSELGRALAFDIHVQNGGIKPAARHDIATALERTRITTEQELRVIVANAVADASTSFKEDVRSRKLTIATGTGRVHGDTFVLSQWGLDETLADS